jgi:hypothetical protein
MLSSGLQLNSYESSYNNVRNAVFALSSLQSNIPRLLFDALSHSSSYKCMSWSGLRNQRVSYLDANVLPYVIVFCHFINRI